MQLELTTRCHHITASPTCLSALTALAPLEGLQLLRSVELVGLLEVCALSKAHSPLLSR